MKLLNLVRKVLYEDIRRPTEEDVKMHNKKKPSGGKLYYMVVSSGGKRLGYIDAQYIKELKSKEGKKYTPKAAAKRRLEQIEHFKETSDK